MIYGALYGLLTWLVYGIVEFALTCIFPLFTSDSQISPWEWPLIGRLFVVYALAGLFLGGLSGALVTRRGSKSTFQTIASLTLVLGFIANLIPAWPLARSEDTALGVAIVLALLLITAISSQTWEKRLVFLSGPWTICLLLVSGPWISRDWLHNSKPIVKAGVSWLALGAIPVAAWIVDRIRSRRPASLMHQAAVAGMAVGAIAVALFFNSTSGVRSAPAVSPQAQGRPNMVLITMDTVRADHLPVYGYTRNTTPNLSELARGSTVYTRAIAAADFTLPAHASIFTGLYPAWHGSVFAPPEYPLGRPLGADAVTLADQLRSRGYWTAAVVANRGYLFPAMGLLKGFTEVQDFGPVLLTSPDRPFYLRLGAQRILRWAGDDAHFEAISLRAEDVNRRAYSVLERVNQSRGGAPFFLFLNYMDAHQPYIPPARFDSMFPGRDPHFSSAGFESLKNAVISGRRTLSPRERDHLIAEYDGGIAYIDSEIGKLIARLRQTGLYENTLLIVTSDHGEAFGEHGLLEHAVNSVYQDHVSVPLLIKYPSQSGGNRSEISADQVDLVPTIFDVLKYPPAFLVQGRSLLTGQPAIAFSESRPSPQNLQPANIRRAVFDGSMKLIASLDGSREVYDVGSDPGEQHNLYNSASPVSQGLEERLAAWVKSMPRQNGQTKGERGIDKPSLERLKSLGYVQ